MSSPHQTFNEARAARATSERSFSLGPYTMKRVMNCAPEVILEFRSMVDSSGGADAAALAALEQAIHALVEPVVVDASGAEVAFSDAWRTMRTVGDQYGPLGLDDLLAIGQWLVGGVVERPTELPSDSSDGSTTPTTGTPSTAPSPSEVLTPAPSTPDVSSTPSTLSS